MKILYHHRTLGDGAEGIHIREIVNAFRQLGHKVTVAGPVGELQTNRGQQGYLSKIKLLLPRILFELLEVAYSAFCFVDLVRKAKALDADFIYDRYITFNAGALWAARFCHIPLVLEVNAPLALERSNESDEKLHFKKLAHYLERYVCSNADMTLVVSTPLKCYLESIGVPKGKCVVMPNGVDQVKFRPMPKKNELIQKLEIPVDSVVIGFTGILRPWHGVEMLITAVADLKKLGKSVYLLIVGDGPIWEKLDKELQKAGLSECSKITGRIAHDKIADYVSLFDIAVSPKATFYASPMKITEYMAMGKAVVAPDSENLIDMIDDGENGILFKKDSTASLTECLDKLFGSAELRQQMGQNAREKVETRLNWEWNAREVIKLINTFVIC